MNKFSFLIVLFLIMNGNSSGQEKADSADIEVIEPSGQENAESVETEIVEPSGQESPDSAEKDVVKPSARVAILNFKAYNTPQTYADGVRDILEVNLYKTGIFHILEREQIDVILREHEIRDKWCVDQGCAVEIGKLLSTDKVIVGSISGMGNYSITVKLVNIKNGDVEHADSEVAESEKDIPAATQRLADRFASDVRRIYEEADLPLQAGPDDGALTKTDEAAEEEPDFFKKLVALWDHPDRPYYVRGLVPGWGQYYSGRFHKGYIFAGVFSAALLYTGYALYNFRQKREEYEDLSSGTDSDFDRKHDAAGDALNRANTALWLLGGLYIINIVDVIFFSRPGSAFFSDTGILMYRNNNSAVYAAGGIDYSKGHEFLAGYSVVY